MSTEDREHTGKPARLPRSHGETNPPLRRYCVPVDSKVGIRAPVMTAFLPISVIVFTGSLRRAFLSPRGAGQRPDISSDRAARKSRKEGEGLGDGKNVMGQGILGSGRH